MNLVYEPTRSGAAKAHRRLAETLSKRGHDVHVVALGVPALTATLAGVQVDLASRYDDLRSAFTAALDLVRPDVVLVSCEDPASHLLKPAMTGYAASAAILASATSLLPFGPQAFFPNPTQTALFAQAGAIITVSEATRQYVAQFTNQQAVTLRYPVFDPPVPMPAPDGGRRDIVMVNPCAIKGIGIFLGLADAFPAESFVAVPAWGTTAADLEALSARSNIEIVEFEEDVENLYARTRVLLVPSRWPEALGQVVVEAMWRGIPVLSSDVGGLPEAKGDTGFIIHTSPVVSFERELDDRGIPVPVMDQADLTPWKDALASILSDQALYDGESARSRLAAASFVEQVDMGRWEEVLSRLADRAEEPPVVAVAGTFTLDPLLAGLRFWIDRLQLPHRVELGPYNQPIQALLDPQGAMQRSQGGLNVLAVRLWDWRVAGVRATADELIETIVKARLVAPLLVLLLPSPDPRSDQPELSARIRRELEALPGVHVLDDGDISRWYPVSNKLDAYTDHVGHVPYAPKYFAAMATSISRVLSVMSRAPRKVIAVDADGTLWRGVCAEDGPLGVEMDHASLVLQRFVVEQRKRGALICVCSKNMPESVDAVFEHRHEEMPLKRSHITSWRVEWNAKSHILQTLAAELDVGLDSFIFVDDNPLECADIRANCPQVAVVELKPDVDRQAMLAHAWCFDTLEVTDEDTKRADRMAVELERRKLQEQTSSLADFLASLELVVDIVALSPSQLPRAAQLTVRTNQFNARPNRLDQAALTAYLGAGHADVVKVRDRFGDYGIVGVMMYAVEGGRLRVDAFLLSCRALGRGVEHAMMRHLGAVATELGATELDVRHRTTSVNVPVQRFLKGLGGHRLRTEEETVIRVDAGDAMTVRHEVNAPAKDARSRRATNETTRITPGVLQDIAWELRNIEDIERAISGQWTNATPTDGAAGLPDDGLEAELIGLWRGVLHRSVIGADEDFFDLGGTSLSALQLFSQVEGRFGVRLPLSLIFELNTVASMAEHVDEARDKLVPDDAVSTSIVGSVLAVNEKPHVMILTLQYTADELVGGLGTHVTELARGLHKQGVELDILVIPQQMRADAPRSDPNGPRVHYAAEQYATRYEDALACARDVIARHGAPHIVHFHDLFHFPVAAALKGQHRSLTLGTAHLPYKQLAQWTDDELAQKFASLEERAFRDADALIAVSHSMGELLRTEYTLKSEALFVVHNGLETARFSALADTEEAPALPDGSPIVLFAGRLTPMKGVDAFYAMAEELGRTRPDVHFVVAGAPEINFHHRYQAVRERHAAARDRIVELGWVERQRLPALFRRADVVVMPSIYEPFGYAALEAMTIGAPVVGTRVGGLAEIIEHDHSGLLVEVDTLPDGHRATRVDELVAAVDRLLTDATLRQRIGDEAQRRAAEFSVDRMVDATLDVYRWMLGASC